MGAMRKIVFYICLMAMMSCSESPSSVNNKIAEEPDDVQDIPATSLEGYIRASIGNSVFEFDTLPVDRNHVMPLTSSFWAQSSSDSQTRFVITFLYVSLKELTYPVNILPDRSSDDPKLAKGTVGFAYIDEQGAEWAGPGKISIHSFKDGLIEGSFSNVSLPHVDKALPNIVLTDGAFQLQL